MDDLMPDAARAIDLPMCFRHWCMRQAPMDLAPQFDRPTTRSRERLGAGRLPLRAAQGGEIRLGGVANTAMSRRAIAQRLSLMPQLVEDAFPATVFEEALAGRNPHLAPWAWESAEDEAVTRAALAEVGLGEFESRLTSTLSGGERRRVQLATVLVQDAPLVLLDEP